MDNGVGDDDDVKKDIMRCIVDGVVGDGRVIRWSLFVFVSGWSLSACE